MPHPDSHPVIRKDAARGVPLDNVLRYQQAERFFYQCGRFQLESGHESPAEYRGPGVCSQSLQQPFLRLRQVLPEVLVKRRVPFSDQGYGPVNIGGCDLLFVGFKIP